jgi:hypothetical protein
MSTVAQPMQGDDLVHRKNVLRNLPCQRREIHGRVAGSRSGSLIGFDDHERLVKLLVGVSTMARKSSIFVQLLDSRIMSARSSLSFCRVSRQPPSSSSLLISFCWLPAAGRSGSRVVRSGATRCANASGGGGRSSGELCRTRSSR